MHSLDNGQLMQNSVCSHSIVFFLEEAHSNDYKRLIRHHAKFNEYTVSKTCRSHAFVGDAFQRPVRAGSTRADQSQFP